VALFVVSCWTGRDEDVLVVHGWCDEASAAELVGSDGRISTVVLEQEGISGA